MARFLITGSRAPVALELVRNLAGHGHIVYLADSLRYPLANHSKCVEKSFYIPAPRRSVRQFQVALENILQGHGIDILIPTCEEVFYISAIKSALGQHARVFCPDFAQIRQLHSKIAVFAAARNTGFLSPHTETDTAETLLSRGEYTGKVIKKEFCRFGTDVLIEPDATAVSNLVKSSPESQFIVQDKVVGQEYCTYAIAKDGEVRFASIYKPTHRVRMAAGIYFEPVHNQQLIAAIQEFCKKNHITGQIGLDVIVNEVGIYLLECNPRATSGLHLLSDCDLAKGFAGSDQVNQTFDIAGIKTARAKMIKLAMLLIGLPIAIKNRRYKQWKQDYSCADDVISTNNDHSFGLYSLASFAEIVLISLKGLTSLRAASTYDIEWDGELLNAE